MPEEVINPPFHDETEKTVEYNLARYSKFSMDRSAMFANGWKVESSKLETKTTAKGTYITGTITYKKKYNESIP